MGILLLVVGILGLVVEIALIICSVDGGDTAAKAWIGIAIAAIIFIAMIAIPFVVSPMERQEERILVTDTYGNMKFDVPVQIKETSRFSTNTFSIKWANLVTVAEVTTKKE